MIRGEEMPPEEKEKIMALTRKALKAMGLTEEQVDSIIEAHTETIDGLKDQIKTYRADAERLESVQKELDALKGGEDYKAKYEAEISKLQLKLEVVDELLSLVPAEEPTVDEELQNLDEELVEETEEL